MISSIKKLEAAVSEGRTIALLLDMSERSGTFRWVFTDTSVIVSRAAVMRLVQKGKLSVLQWDLCGEPIQYGALTPGVDSSIGTQP